MFAEILYKGIRSGQVPARTQEAREWYRGEAKAIKKVNINKLMREEKMDLTNMISPGNLYLFMYDPKHKKTLPYYDNAPLVFPFRKVKGGFLGINMHYLPPVYRAKLMDALYGTLNNDKFDETTKLRLSYQMLNGASKFKYFRPCVKHYLMPHCRSRFLKIPVAMWDYVLFLNTARFEGATSAAVHQDSRKKIV